MKKIYSIVLMAAMLFVGTNVWADDISVVNHTKGTSQTFNDLQEAVNFVGAGDSATITLLNSITLSKAVVIPQVKGDISSTNPNILNRNPQIITLDLGNNHNIQGDDNATKGYGCIHMYKGKLHIVGAGEIRRPKKSASSNPDKSVITLYGAPWDQRTAGEWTVLTIGENVTLNSTSPVDEGENWKSNTNNKVFGLCIQVTDDVSYSGYDKTNDVKSTGKIGYTTNLANMTDQPTDKGWTKKDGKYRSACAYGIKVLIKGKIFGHYRGINVVGTLNSNPQQEIDAKVKRSANYPYYTYYYPYVKIAPTADVWCIDDGITNDGNGGIYAGGYVVWDISGYVHGQTGILAKAGDFILDDATVASDSPHSENSANYHSGSTAGSGIFLATDASYVGGASMTMEGDTKVSGNGACAITDQVASNSNGSTVSHIDINSGTIEPGAEGAITIQSTTVENTTVAGGNISGAITSVDKNTQDTVVVAVVNLTDAATTMVTTVTDENGKTTYVVAEGKAADIKESAVVYNAGKDSIKWTSASETLDGDVKIDYLEINQMVGDDPMEQVLTIPDGKTLEVKRVILGYGAKIVVKAGAKFIVTGDKGIVANTTNNIILEYDGENGTYAKFLFNPEVTSNRHPNATVEFVTKSWYEDASTYQWERFGVPSYGALQSVTSEPSSIMSQFAEFTSAGWQNLGFLGGGYTIDATKFNKAFATYEVMANRVRGAQAPKYKFAGELVGNIDASLNAYVKWTPFTNSYTADVDLKEFIKSLVANAQNVHKGVYIATSAGSTGEAVGTYNWEPFDLKALEDEDAPKKLLPMQAFILLNKGSMEEANVLNYQAMVWTPDTTKAPKLSAPARRVADDSSAKMRVVVTNENGARDIVKLRESAETTAFEKYMNADINIYAMADEKNGILAVEDLENTYLGFSTVKGGNFTINFANVEGREFTMIDHETGARVAMVEGNAYEFTAAANSVNDYRFEIVESAKLPTAIDNTEAVKSAKGIYTITGQYLGEMNVWNMLPAGVYVINGEKRVK